MNNREAVRREKQQRDRYVRGAQRGATDTPQRRWKAGLSATAPRAAEHPDLSKTPSKRALGTGTPCSPRTSPAPGASALHLPSPGQ